MNTGIEQSRREELVNSITHGVGIVLGIVGTVVLVAVAALYGTAWHIVGCSVYGVTLILMFLASTLYHSFHGPRIKHIFNVLDHSAIYLLIAGTYTPFTLNNLRGVWGWVLFGVVWSLALCGILYKAFCVGKFPVLSTILYVGMGWIVIVAVKPVVHALPPAGLALLFGGGISYTLGVIFYVWRSLPYNHAIWHLFVLGGGVLQYMAVLLCVIPWARG
ncbi:MAG: hemolysin III family protein [bacterium]|nr:hemolysin III family protein [bacterium]